MKIYSSFQKQQNEKQKSHKIVSKNKYNNQMIFRKTRSSKNRANPLFPEINNM